MTDRHRPRGSGRRFLFSATVEAVRPRQLGRTAGL
jgi:hypothetical protein